MPSAAVLGPVVIPLVAAVGIAAFGLARIDLGRMAAAAGAWGSVVALFAVWLPVRSSLELTLGQLGYGSAFDLRIDGVTFAFGMMIALPAALLLTLQPRAWQEVVLSMLGLTAAMAAVEAGGVVLTAIAGGTAATIAMVLLDTEDPRARRPSWGLLLAGWLALTWVGVILQVGGGTAVYSAVPVATVNGPIFALVAASAVLASCLFPWRTWPAELWARPSLRAAGVTIATLYPLGFYLLVPDRAGIAPLLTIAAAVGLPPGIAFGARAVGIEATFEAGDFLGLIGVAAAAAWATWMVGGARAIGLPGGRGHPAAETFPRVSMLIAALTLISGPALAAIQFGVAAPGAAEVMPSSAGSLGGGLPSVVTVSSVLPVVLLFVPLLVIGVVPYASTGTSPIRTQARPALFK